MTGLDCLKEELRKRGYKQQQIESKIVVDVLDILANSGGKYSDIHKLEHYIRTLEGEIASMNAQYAKSKRRAAEFEEKKDEIVKEINDSAELCIREKKEYIDKFFRAVEECETPEGKDTMKKAQMFVNTVNLNTKYDNTAFIIGLASILAHENVAPIEELRKINPDVPRCYMESETSKVYFGEHSDYIVKLERS